MAIKKVRANFDTSGTGTFDTLHYETQAKQVKVLDASGNVTSDINEILFDGKSLTGVSLNTTKSSGRYKIKGCTGMPTGLSSTETYIFEVMKINNGTADVVKQVIDDHVGKNKYTRFIVGSTVGAWVTSGESIKQSITEIQSDITALEGDVSSLESRATGHDTSITNLTSNIASLSNQVDTHKHDSLYAKLAGGIFTGETSVANDKSFAGKNTSGLNLNLGKVDSLNKVVLGDAGAKTVIQASSGDVSISDGTITRKLFHEGNMGHGSNLDADKVDGIEGALFARRDATNYFKQSQVVDDGKHLYFESPDGSEATGNIVWRNSGGIQKGKIAVSTDGNLSIFAGEINGHTFKSDGELFSNRDHIFDAQSREVRIAMRKGSSDKGIGFYMNPNDNSFKLGDWNLAQSLMTVYRDTGEINFAKNIKVQGHRLFIQSGTPSNPSTGDIWFDI